MSARLQWNGDEASKKAHAALVRFVTWCAIKTANQAKELLSVAGTGKVKGKQTGPVVHSQPGEPPRKQTGRGRASVTYEVDQATATARVGTNVDYMAHQERGTKRGLAPRPWLRPAFEWLKTIISSYTPPTF
jgi:hypothetical protein